MNAVIGDSDESTATETLSNVVNKTDNVIVDLVDDDIKENSNANENLTSERSGDSKNTSKPNSKDKNTPSLAWTNEDWEGTHTDTGNIVASATAVITPSRILTEKRTDWQLPRVGVPTDKSEKADA